MTNRHSFWTSIVLRTAKFPTLEIGFRLEGEEDGAMETRIISLDTKNRHNFQDFFHLHSSGRSSSLSPSYDRRASHSPCPQPLISLLASQSLSGDLHNTALTDLNVDILGVYNSRKTT